MSTFCMYVTRCTRLSPARCDLSGHGEVCASEHHVAAAIAEDRWLQHSHRWKVRVCVSVCFVAVVVAFIHLAPLPISHTRASRLYYETEGSELPSALQY